MDEIQFTEYVVTCETNGCENGQIPIPVQAPVENPYFICGVCTMQITNFVLTENK